MLVFFFCGLLCLGKEFLCALGEGSFKGGVTNLTVNKVIVGSGGSLGIKVEGILALVGLAGIIAEVEPISGLNGGFFLGLACAHTLADTVIDAGSVSDLWAREGPLGGRELQPHLL